MALFKCDGCSARQGEIDRLVAEKRDLMNSLLRLIGRADAVMLTETPGVEADDTETPESAATARATLEARIQAEADAADRAATDELEKYAKAEGITDPRILSDV